jgi:hypothetical protein
MGFNSAFKGLKILSLLDVDNLHSQQITKGNFRLFGSVEPTTSQVTLHGPKLIFCLVPVLLGYAAASLDSPSNKF